MSVPWYVSGAPRPDYAKYRGWKADAKQVQDTVARLKAAAASPAPAPVQAAPVWSPAPTPVWNPTPVPQAVAAPQPVQQSVVPVQLFPLTQQGTVPLSVPPPDPVVIVPEEESQGGYEPPDPLGWYPGGSEGFFERLGQLPGAFNDWIGNLGISWETPGMESRREKREEEQASEDTVNQRQAERLIEDIVQRNWERNTDLKTTKQTKDTRKDKREENHFELDLSDWNSLTPRQQASVESNLTTWTAIERDNQYGRRKVKGLDREQRTAYLQDYEQIFGESGDQDMIVYAPETVGALKSLNVQAVNNPYTLDEFLAGDALTTSNQVANIGMELPQPRQISSTEYEPVELTRRQERLKFAQQLADAQMKLNTTVIEEELDRGRRVLSGMSYGQVSEQAQEYGAREVEQPGEKPLSDTEEQTVQILLGTLADETNNPDELVGEISAELGRREIPEERQGAIYDRMRAVVINATKGGPWFAEQQNQGVKIRNPQIVAQALGMPVQKSG